MGLTELSAGLSEDQVNLSIFGDDGGVGVGIGAAAPTHSWCWKPNGLSGFSFSLRK